MPARTNVCLSVGKSIYKSCTTLHHSWAHSCGIWLGYIRRLLISSYSKVTHVHYGRHVIIAPAASLNICTLVNGYDA